MKGALGMISGWFEGVTFGLFVREPVARLGRVRAARKRSANDRMAA